jgi:hypothetical protein
MLVLTPVALAAWTGHLSIDHMRVYAHVIESLALPVAAGVLGTVAGLAALLVLVKHLRTVVVAVARAYWLYRRRWASVLADLGLTETKGEQVKTPRLRSVVRHNGEDIVTVRMLPGQSAATYHERSAALAAEFGASSARVRFGDVPHREVVIVFDRRRAPWREPLALPAPQPHPLPLHLPQDRPQHQQLPWQQQQQREAGPQSALHLSGLRLQIVWARTRRACENGRKVRVASVQWPGLWWGELRWT